MGVAINLSPQTNKFHHQIHGGSTNLSPQTNKVHHQIDGEATTNLSPEAVNSIETPIARVTTLSPKTVKFNQNLTFKPTNRRGPGISARNQQISTGLDSMASKIGSNNRLLNDSSLGSSSISTGPGASMDSRMSAHEHEFRRPIAAWHLNCFSMGSSRGSPMHRYIGTDTPNKLHLKLIGDAQISAPKHKHETSILSIQGVRSL